MANNIFVYWSDGLGAIIAGTEVGRLPTKIARRAGHLTIFSSARDLPGGVRVLAAAIDSHIMRSLGLILYLDLRMCVLRLTVTY